MHRIVNLGNRTLTARGDKNRRFTMQFLFRATTYLSQPYQVLQWAREVLQGNNTCTNTNTQRLHPPSVRHNSGEQLLAPASSSHSSRSWAASHNHRQAVLSQPLHAPKFKMLFFTFSMRCRTHGIGMFRRLLSVRKSTWDPMQPRGISAQLSYNCEHLCGTMVYKKCAQMR